MMIAPFHIIIIIILMSICFTLVVIPRMGVENLPPLVLFTLMIISPTRH